MPLIRQTVRETIASLGIQSGGKQVTGKNTEREAKEPGQKLLKPGEAAKYLAISPRHLWDLAKKGEVPVVRIGRATRYDIRDLDSWVEEQKTRTRE